MLKTIQIFDYAAIKQAIYKKFPELVALEFNPTKVFAFLPNGTGLEIELFNATGKIMARCKKLGFEKDLITKLNLSNLPHNKTNRLQEQWKLKEEY